MGLSFLPNRDNMCKEIEQWIALRKMDTLMSVCSCCMFKAYDFMLPKECNTCTIRRGILKIADEKNREVREVAELLQAC